MNLVEFWERFDRGDRNFQGCVIEEINFDYVDFDGVDFSNADLRDAKIRRTTFENCNFSGAILIGCDLDEVSINNSKLIRTKFNACTTTELYIDRCDLSEAQFISAHLGDVYFTKSNLSKSQWQQAHFCGGFTECDLTNARMDGLFASSVEMINTIFPNGVSVEMSSWREVQIEGEPTTSAAPVIIHDTSSVELKSAVGIDYTMLRNLLSECRWSEANEKTAELLWQILNDDSSDVEPEDIDKIPCIDLITIDMLWAENSWGHFGFTVQQERWISIYGGYDYNPSKYELFCKVIWRLDSRLENSFNTEQMKDEQSIKLVPIGFYPDTMFCMISSEEDKVLANLYRRLSECQIELGN